MAKHLVFDYDFDASAKTVTLDGIYAKKRLLLITNMNDNEIIYSFTDPSKGVADIAFDYTNYTTTITLDYDTTAMADTDPLQVFVEADSGTVQMADPYLDPVSKMRVSNPENLIDTDFEYGLQSTKWETLELTKNIPTFFARNGDQEIEITDITTQAGSDLITVITTEAHGFQRGSPIIMVGSSTITADGGFVVASVIDDNTFTYKCKGEQPLSTSIAETYTQLFAGSVYSGTEFKLANVGAITTDSGTPSQLTVATEYPTNFTDGTSMVLSNTYAQSSVNFSTDNVEPNNTYSLNDSYTNATPTGETNFSLGGANYINFTPKTKTFYFDESTVTIDTVQDTIDFGVPHGFSTNEAVVYINGSNNNLAGISAMRGMYVQAVNSTTLRFYRYINQNSLIQLSTTKNNDGIMRSALAKAYEVTTYQYPTWYQLRERPAEWTSVRANNRAITLFGYQGQSANFYTEMTSPYFDVDPSYDYYLQPFDSTTGRFQGYVDDTTSSTVRVWFDNGWFVLPIEDANAVDGNTLYLPDHGLQTGDYVTVTATTGTLPAGLSSGATYRVGNTTTDRLSFQTTGGSDINFNSAGSNSLVYNLTATTQLASADSITIPNFELGDGDAITYNDGGGTTIGGLSDGSTYYIARKTGDRFNLSTTSNYIANTFTIVNQARSTYVDLTNNRVYISVPTGMTTGTCVEYISANPIGGLTSGALYFVRDVFGTGIYYQFHPTAADAAANTNVVDLVAYGSGQGLIRETNLVDITSTPVGETQSFLANFIGAADGIYSVSGTAADQLSFTFDANNQITPRTFLQVSQESFSSTLNGFRVDDHGFVTGDAGVVTLTGTTNISGITSGNTYYLIAASKDFFQLAATQEDALVGTAITLTPTGVLSSAASGTIDIEVASIVGKFSGTGTVSFEADSTTILGEGTKFTSYFNSGDTFQINVPPSTTATAITNYSPAGDYFIANGHGLSDGDTVFFTATTSVPPGVDSASLYYVNTSNTGDPSNRFSIHYSQTSAEAGTELIQLTGFGTGASVNHLEDTGSIITRTIDYVNSDGQITVTEALPSTAQTDVNYFLTTQLLLRSDGFALHRPYDGGVELIPSTNPDSQMIRQTRKYFRYQSGKGIQVSFAVNFSPTTQADTFTASGTTGTITTRFPHRMSAGLTIVTSGSTNTDQDTIGTKTYDVLVGTDSSGNTVFTINGVDLTAGLELYEGRTYRFDQSDSSNSGFQLLFSTTEDGDNNGGTEYTTGVTKNGTPGTAGAYTEITVAASAPTLYTYVSGTAGVGFTATTPTDPQNGVANLWNGELEVLSVIDDNTFTVQLPGTPSDLSASGLVEFYVQSWENSALRCGLYDDQNGIFFEFDGQELYVCRRSSIRQLSGYASAEFRSGLITGVDTRFNSQLSVGDQIVIKGQTHVVTKINSDTQMAISPSYRGITSDKIIITKTETTRVPQRQWNLDVCDGTGHTGFNLNIYRIQMAYIDYSWYGAGKVRFGFKDQNGDVKYVHEFVHGNFFTEAYMRSGNLPARYEIQNTGAPTYVPALAHWGTSIIMDGRFDNDRAYVFNASSNNLTVTGAASLTADGKIDFLGEYYQRIGFNIYNAGYAILLDAPDSNLASVTAGTAITGAGLAANTTAANPNSFGVSPYQPYLPQITSWEGTNRSTQATRTLLLLDKAPLATAGTSSTYTIGSGTARSVTSPFPLISVRLAPSVDTSTPGVLGEREIINRMQLILSQVAILSTHTAEISLVLNGQLSTNNWQRVNNPSLSQLLVHTNEDTIVGGASVYNFRASGSTGATGRVQQLTTENLGDVATLGNAILGGDNTYPDGPDVLTVVATLTEDPSSVSDTNPFIVTGRISWSESQA